MNPTVPGNSYMSADKKHIIKCRSVDFCIFCVVSVAPIFRFLLLIEVYIYFHILAFSIAYGDISKIITVPDSCSI